MSERNADGDRLRGGGRVARRADDADADSDLVAAYLDGRAELTPEERTRAEAIIDANPVDAEETTALLAELRDLPPPADPDFRQLEAAIAQALPPPPAKGHRWGAISGVLAAAATIALFVAIRHDGRTPTFPDAAPAPAPAPIGHDPDTLAAAPHAIYFNGEELDTAVDLDALPDDALDDALDEDADLGDLDDYVSLETASGSSASSFGGQFGAEIDQLDDAALDRLDTWLASKKGG
jgi:hypothetical protein